MNGKCPPVKFEGAPEAWTVQSVTAMSMLMSVKAKRDTAAGSIPYATGFQEACGAKWDTATVRSEMVETDMQVPHPMMLAMPEAMGGEIKVSKDRRSFIEDFGKGWVWTLTPAIVK
jgi:hypothetical protein